MTNTDLSSAVPVPRKASPAPAQIDRRKGGRIGRKLAAALKAIVWEGQELDVAAQAAGMTTHAVRCALYRPHVVAFMKREREMLHAYVSAQNIHHARRMRNESTNEMAKLGAMRFIDGMAADNAGRSGTSHTMPGLVIQIVSQPVTQTNEKLLIDQGRHHLDQMVDDK